MCSEEIKRSERARRVQRQGDGYTETHRGERRAAGKTKKEIKENTRQMESKPAGHQQRPKR